ncbi:MAG: DUF2203 domain-containing protein [Pseudonocardiales bacterium]|nr:MAG: DUF2203 domain-containing protein [Pseudonocardiales bacterium]
MAPAVPDSLRPVSRIFTLAEARALLPDVRRQAATVIGLRADLAESAYALRLEEARPAGALPEAKAAEARLAEALAWFGGQGLELKGYAPLLLDFPADLGDGVVLLCWLEGDVDLAWWHRPELGFAGRRPIQG